LTVMTARRFWAMFSGVSLGATLRDSPKLIAATLSVGKPA
jgi:hypothetical protein